jgi:hypothetical protein
MGSHQNDVICRLADKNHHFLHADMKQLEQYYFIICLGAKNTT